jgi:hypothetical protein
MTKKNQLSQRQFKNGYVPVQPADEFDRTYRQEPAPPSLSKSQMKRMNVNLGSMSQARPGLVGKQDFKRKPKGKK